MSIWFSPAVLSFAVCCGLAIALAAAVLGRHHEGLERMSVRLLLSAGVFVVVLLVGLAVTTGAPRLLGLPLVLAPGFGVAAALLLFGAVPWRTMDRRAIRSAALVRRPAWSAATARAYGRPIIVGCALIAVLIVTGLTGSPDDAGRSRAFTVTEQGSTNSASPYPGWFYSAPLLAMTVAIVVAGAVAIRRTALLPARSLDPAVDALWRHGIALVLSRIATAGLLLYLAATLLMVGDALRTTSLNMPGGWGTGAAAASLCGLLAAVTALASLASAVRRATFPPSKVAV